MKPFEIAFEPLRSFSIRVGIRITPRLCRANRYIDDPRARSYRADILLMLNRGLRRLTVSIDEIRSHSRELADGLLNTPFDYSQAFDNNKWHQQSRLSNLGNDLKHHPESVRRSLQYNFQNANPLARGIGRATLSKSTFQGR